MKTTLFKLYSIFFKIGLFTFGGGYAMLALLEREIVDKNQYTTKEELIDFYSIAQITPGIIAVNVSTFIGFKERKVFGSIFATLGLVTPSVIIIILVASLLDNFSDILIVNQMINGLRIGVSALILKSLISLYQKSVTSKFSFLIMLTTLLTAVIFQVSVVLIISAFLLLSFIYSYLRYNNVRTD